VLKAIRQHAKRKDLRLRHSFIGGFAVRKDPGQLRDLRQPPSVLFSFMLDGEIHRESSSSKWQRTASNIRSSSSGIVAACVKIDSPTARA
jgi:hypothetical protein